MGYTAPTWIKSKPHASAEKQVGDSDPSARIDVINRVEKGYYAVIRRILTTLGFDTVDFTDQTTVTSLGGPTVAHLHVTDLAAITTAAESWVGPSSTTGVYFKGGNSGFGTVTPGAPVHIGNATAGNQKLLQIREPGPDETYGLILRGNSGDGVFKWYGLNASVETTNSILSMDRFSGNVGIGTITPGGAGTVGTMVFSLANGTPPVGGVANQVSLFSKDVTASAELFAMDEAGNTPQLSPHPSDFLDILPLTGREYPWAYSASNPYLGKKIQVDMMGLVRAVEKLSGEKFISLSELPPEERADWDAGQEAQRILRDQAITMAQREVAAINDRIEKWEIDPAEIANLTAQRDAVVIPRPYVKKSPPRWMRDRGVAAPVREE